MFQTLSRITENYNASNAMEGTTLTFIRPKFSTYCLKYKVLIYAGDPRH